MKKDKSINKLVKEIAIQRAKIIDDFCKVYIASKSYKMTEPQIRELIQNLELTQQRTSDGLGWIFSFKVKEIE